MLGAHGRVRGLTRPPRKRGSNIVNFDFTIRHELTHRRRLCDGLGSEDMIREKTFADTLLNFLAHDVSPCALGAFRNLWGARRHDLENKISGAQFSLRYGFGAVLVLELLRGTGVLVHLDAQP